MSNDIQSNAPEQEASTEQVQETAQGAEKTFTQDEVNRIVSERLSKERKKVEAAVTGEYTAELAEREKNILQRELKLDAKERLAEKGLPATVADLLNYDNEESYNNSFDKVTEVFTAVIDESTEGKIKQILKGQPPKTATMASNDPIKTAFAPKK